MKSLSPRAAELLRELDAGPDVWREKALPRELAEQAEPGLVRPLFLSVLRSQGPAEFLLALESLSACLGPGDVRELDLRSRESTYRSLSYSEMGDPEFARALALSPAVAALLTCHPSGYRRQAALEHLRGGHGAALTWPFLLLRLNDWVLPVREAALQCATEALAEVPLPVLMRHFALVDFLGQLRRADHAPFVERVWTRLRQPEALAWLASHFGTLPALARRSTLRWMLTHSEALARPLVEAGLEDGDSKVRELAAGRVDALFSGEDLVRLLGRMERSRATVLRLEAYALYARRVAGLGETKLREALNDSATPVRDYAQRRLAESLDVAGWYRAALARPSPRAGILAGLGETGGAADAALLLPFLTHPHPPLRRAAVVAVGRLEGDGHAAALREAVRDAVPSISRAAIHALAQKPGRFSLDWLRESLAPPELAPHTLHSLLLLAEHLSFQEDLLVLLAVTARPEAERRALAHLFFQRWLALPSSRYVSASAAHPYSVLREAVRATPGLEPEMAEQVQQVLRALE